MPAITLFPFIFRLSLTILFVFFISDSLPFVTFQRPAVRSPRRILYLWSSFPVPLFQPGLKHKLLQIYRLIRYGFRVCLYLRNSSLQRFLFIFAGHKQGHEAPVKQLSAGVSGVDMYDRIIITHWSASCYLNRMFFWRCDSNAFSFINRRFPTYSTCFSQPLVPVIWRSLLMLLLK